MKILVVDDEVKTCSFLEKGLSENGFGVDCVYNGEDGLELALSRNYDLIILDVMMPKLDGWMFIEKLRKSGCHSMTLFLTARDSLSDRVRGLELGADAYLVKPFAFTELLAQVRTLLRRSNMRISETVKVADLELDLIKHAASRAGRKLDLTPKEFALLSLLMRRKDEILSRSMIADQIWNINFETDTNVVDVHINRLRGKVDVLPSKKLIHTVRGMGYKLSENE